MEYIPAKTIVTRVKDKRWFGLDYNMNIYRGCPHGCIYCDSRSACYQIDDFGTVRVKQDALRIIRGDLLKKPSRRLDGETGGNGVVATGSMSDPYNPFEKELKLTRNALELLNAYRFGVAIATKSPLVTRDKAILRDIKSHSPVLVKITITAADDGLARLVEPNAPPPGERFAAVQELSEAGIYTGVLLMPVLPFIEDTEENVLAVVRRAAECGARFVYPALGMTLRTGNREYFYEQLERNFPGRDLARLYEKKYGENYYCPSPRAKKLWAAFTEACAAAGLRYGMPSIIADYKRPYRQFAAVQGELF